MDACFEIYTKRLKRPVNGTPQDTQISVVMGSHAPALGSVRLLAASLPCVTEMLVNVPDMAALAADAGLAICTSGSTTWERCCLGLPSLVVETAVNQAGAAAAMKKAGAALSIRPLTDRCFGELLALAHQQLVKAQFIVSLPHALARLFDGDGALRGAKLLEGNV